MGQGACASGRIRAWASARGLRVWDGRTLFDEDGYALNEKSIRLTVSGFGEYQVAPDGFWQAHREAARVLCEQVIAAASSDCEPGSAALSAPGEGRGNAVSGEGADTAQESGSAAASENSEPLLTPGNRQWKEILELYSGAGLFSRPLAKILDRGGRLSTLEGSKTAVKMARKNLSGVPGRIDVRAGRVDARALADYAGNMRTPPPGGNGSAAQRCGTKSDGGADKPRARADYLRSLRSGIVSPRPKSRRIPRLPDYVLTVLRPLPPHPPFRVCCFAVKGLLDMGIFVFV